MESHPIPQQISSYQFRLVGDMTLKQFFQLGGGILAAVIIYSTGMLPIFKWPLMIFSAGLGAALAFLPFEERPLSKWIFSFFRSIYSPTIYNWQKTVTPEVFFEEDTPSPALANIVAPQGTAPMETYLTTLPQVKEAARQKLENQESTFLDKISSLFPKTTPSIPSPVPAPERIGGSPAPTPPPPENRKPEMVIPEVPVVKIPRSNRPKFVIEEEQNPPQETETAFFVPPSQPVKNQPATAAEFSSEASPPNPPAIPNTIVGQILSDQGKIIEGAILEIRDMAGRPVRALRSNKVGHFMVVTALSNGQYEIATEKEGFKFDPVSFELKGEILPPVVIRAKQKVEIKDAPYVGKPLIIN